MDINNIKVDSSFYDVSNVMVETSISSLAKLKKLKTSEEKKAALEAWVKEAIVATIVKPVEEVKVEPIESIIEQPQMIETPVEIVTEQSPEVIIEKEASVSEFPSIEEKKEEEAIELPIEEKVIDESKIEAPKYSFEVEDKRLAEENVIVDEPKIEQPKYSFEVEEKPIENEVYKENKLTSIDYSSLNSMGPTEKLESDLEKAEGPMEKQVLSAGVQELQSKDELIKIKKQELSEIIAEEQRIKSLEEEKRKEIEFANNDKKDSIKKIETAVGKAKQVDSLNKMAEEKAKKALEEEEARKAKNEEEQRAIEEQKAKVLSEIPIDLKPEEEKKPTDITNDVVSYNSIADNYDIIASARETLQKLSGGLDEPIESGFGRAA